MSDDISAKLDYFRPFMESRVAAMPHPEDNELPVLEAIGHNDLGAGPGTVGLALQNPDSPPGERDQLEEKSIIHYLDAVMEPMQPMKQPPIPAQPHIITSVMMGETKDKHALTSYPKVDYDGITMTYNPNAPMLNKVLEMKIKRVLEKYRTSEM